MEKENTATMQSKSVPSKAAGEEADHMIVSMERLHEIVNAGGLSGLCTGGVFSGTQIASGVPEGEYTLWKLEYVGGRRQQLYTLN